MGASIVTSAKISLVIMLRRYDLMYMISNFVSCATCKLNSNYLLLITMSWTNEPLSEIGIESCDRHSIYPAKSKVHILMASPTRHVLLEQSYPENNHCVIHILKQGPRHSVCIRGIVDFTAGSDTVWENLRYFNNINTLTIRCNIITHVPKLTCGNSVVCIGKRISHIDKHRSTILDVRVCPITSIGYHNRLRKIYVNKHVDVGADSAPLTMPASLRFICLRRALAANADAKLLSVLPVDTKRKKCCTCGVKDILEVGYAYNIIKYAQCLKCRNRGMMSTYAVRRFDTHHELDMVPCMINIHMVDHGTLQLQFYTCYSVRELCFKLIRLTGIEYYHIRSMKLRGGDMLLNNDNSCMSQGIKNDSTIDVKLSEGHKHLRATIQLLQTVNIADRG